MSRIMILDGANLVVRNFIINPSLSTDGTPIGGIVGFLKSLQKLTREINPDKIVVAWEGAGGSCRRKQQNKNYKKGRKPPKLNRASHNLTEHEVFENRIWQQLRIVEYLNLLPIHQIMVEGVEADDLIAFTTQFSQFSGDQKVIVSSDKDFLQLVNNKTVLYRPIQDVAYNARKVVEEFSIHPDNMALARAISGDKSDGLPGVQGVGLKTLAKRFPMLAEDYEHDINDILKECQKVEKPLQVHKRILESKELIEDNYGLMQLKNPMISPRGTALLRHELTRKDLIFDKTSFILQQSRDGFSELNLSELFAKLRSIVYADKK